MRISVKDLEELGKIGVYKILNTVDNKCYIGGTTMSFQKRMRHHVSLLRIGKHKNPYLQNAWNKYGEESFSFEIIETTEKTEVFKKEQYWIDIKKTEGILYNINPLATGTPNLSKEVIERRARTLKEGYRTGRLIPSKGRIPWNKGKKYHSTDHLKVPKTITEKVIDKLKRHSEKIRESLPEILVYSDNSLIKKYKSAKDLEEDSEKENFELKEYMKLRNKNGRNGYSAYVLRTFNINKSARNKILYKGLLFKFNSPIT